jgi:hypothetical protein
MKKVIFYSFAIFLILCTTVGKANQIAEKILTFQADKSALLRKYTVKESLEFYNRFEKFYKDWQESLNKLPYQKLSRDEQYDFILFRNYLEKEIFSLGIEKKEFLEVHTVTDFAEPIYEFITMRRRGAIPNAPTLSKSFQKVTLDLNQKQAQIKPFPYESWQKAEKASDVVISLIDNLEESYNFYNLYDPEFSWWMELSYSKMANSLKEYAAFLKSHYNSNLAKDDGSGIIGKPIGRDAIIKSLQFEFIPYSPEDLVKIAEQQFAWCETEMLKASRDLGFKNDWKAALEHVKNTYVPPGKQPEMINGLAEEALTFLESRDLITVPELAKETWRMSMMSPEAQKFNPFFLGGERIQISYPTNTMTYEEKMMSMRGNNPHFSKATVHHELIPGHHLQMFMNQRHKQYRQIFGTPFWMEGWALYWELNLWDKEFPNGPEDKIGMLFWRMHRCARIIFSLNYHMEKMTPQQCINFLVDKVGHEYANAEAEVRRSFTGRYGPLYQIAYMVGGLQFYNLQKELVKQGGLTEKEFHDKILVENSIPVEIIRAILKGKALDKNYQTEWKFAEIPKISKK